MQIKHSFSVISSIFGSSASFWQAIRKYLLSYHNLYFAVQPCVVEWYINEPCTLYLYLDKKKKCSPLSICFSHQVGVCSHVHSPSRLTGPLQAHWSAHFQAGVGQDGAEAWAGVVVEVPVIRDKMRQCHLLKIPLCLGHVYLLCVFPQCYSDCGTLIIRGLFQVKCSEEKHVTLLYLHKSCHDLKHLLNNF